MNLDILKQKIAPLVEKSQPFLDKAKIAGIGALDFTQKQLSFTTLFLKTEEEYTNHIQKKRSILIAYDPTDEKYKTLVGLFPLWITTAWLDAADIRFVDSGASGPINHLIKTQDALEMQIRYEWVEYDRLCGIEKIQNWWKNRNYIKDTIKSEIPSQDEKHEAPIDPLKNTI
jgi:hypothetical protein